MQNKIGAVKNPLSVIAIFAGIAEISGTIVLPHIDPNNQELFIWFLMLFPSTLVVLFFITLNWNYKVLYAPSDFKDEEHFVNMQKATTSEIFMKMSDELTSEDEAEETSSNNESDKNVLNLDEARNVISDSEIRLSMGKISTKEERKQHSEIMRSINRQRMREGRLLEDILMNKLQSELGLNIERDMKIQGDNYMFMLDGVARNGGNMTVIEVKRMNRNTFNRSGQVALVDRFRGFYQTLNDAEKKEFSLIFAVATDDEPEKMRSYLEHLLSPLEFKYFIKVYQVDELASGSEQVAS